MKAAHRVAAALVGAAAVGVLSDFVWSQTSTQPEGGQKSTESLAPTFGGIRAMTEPSRDAMLTFTFPVEIQDVLVRGGQRVQKGDVLVQGRDDEYRLQRDLQKITAESDLEIQNAQAELDQAQVECDAQKMMVDRKHAGSEIEYARAKTVLKVKQVAVELAHLQRTLQALQLDVREAQLSRLAIRAPFDGVIDTVLVDAGEVKRETEPVLRIVATDPLWMDVHTPTEETLLLGLKPGDQAWVLVSAPGEPVVQLGKVIEVAPDAAFEAGKRRIRVELPNPRQWPSGLAAWVRFTPPEGEWIGRVAAQSERITRLDPKDQAANSSLREGATEPKQP
jgi:RND family efflux transporter MFP subunit